METDEQKLVYTIGIFGKRSRISTLETAGRIAHTESLLFVHITQGRFRAHGSWEPIAPGSGPSRSMFSTDLLFSPLSRKRLEKYLLAFSLSTLVLLTSCLRLPRSSMSWARLAWRLLAGIRRTRRTSVEIRVAFECT